MPTEGTTPGLVLAGGRWMSAKWWDASEKDKYHQRADLAERAALSVESLRKAGFVARINEDRNWHQGFREPYETVLLRVEIYGENDTLLRARHHLRGFWAALDSRGMPKDYRIGYSTGVQVMQRIGAVKPEQLHMPKRRTLKA